MRTRGPPALLLVLVSLSALTASADSYRYLDFKLLNSDEEPFRFHVDDRAGAPLSASEIEAAARAAFQSWQDLSCAAPVFEFAGTVTDAGIAAPSQTNDGFNTVAIFVTDRADPAYAAALGGGVAAAAALPMQHGGVLVSCDIFLNGVDYTWSTATPTPTGALDLETLLLHEVGHCQGLDHTVSPSATVMDPALPFGDQRRVLTNHDAEHVCLHLPRSGAIGSPCSPQGVCTMMLECLTPPLADGGTGAPFCTRACESEACPFPFVCRDTTQLPEATQACLPATSGNVTRIGVACESSNQCGSDVGVCLTTGWPEGHCTEQCEPLVETCPGGAACDATLATCLQRCRLGIGGCRDGYVCDYAREPIPLCRPRCADDLECEEGAACRTCDGACVAPESMSGDMGARCGASSSCPLGRICLPLPGAPEGLCVQPCETACSACPEGSVCARLGPAGERFCVSACAGGCPDGTRCGAVSEGAVCLPGCRSELDCPVGNVCEQGECTNPFAEPDAGVPEDAGTSPPVRPPGGCGCQGTPVGAWLVVFPFLFFFGVRRR